MIFISNPCTPQTIPNAPAPNPVYRSPLANLLISYLTLQIALALRVDKVTQPWAQSYLTLMDAHEPVVCPQSSSIL